MFLIIIILLGIETVRNILSQNDVQNNLTFNLVAIFALFLTLHEINLNKTESKKTHQHMEKEKATQMIRYYQEEILPLMSKINNNQVKKHEIIEPFENKRMIYFDYDEYCIFLKENRLEPDDYQEKYSKSIKDINFLKSYVENLCVANNDDYYDYLLCHFDYIEQNKSKKSSIIINPLQIEYDKLGAGLIKKEVSKRVNRNKEEKLKEDEVNKDIQEIKDIVKNVNDAMNEKINNDMNMAFNKAINLYHADLADLLNKIEYFSVSFMSNVADESIAYQSLHQTFTRTIESLYPNISMINRDPKNKYYTNTIELYNLWKDRFIEFEKKEEEIFKEGQLEKEKLQHKYEKKHTSN